MYFYFVNSPALKGNWIASSALTVFTLSCLCSYIAYLIFISDKGFFIDEMFLIQAALNPTEYHFMLTWFGYLLNPIFEIVNFDIVLYRRAWLFFSGVLAFGFSVLAALFIRSRSHFEIGIINQINICLTIYLATLFQFSYYTGPTPGYNSLALFGSMLFWIGIFCLELRGLNSHQNPRMDTIFYGLIVVSASGVTIAFLCRATTGLMLICTGVVWILLRVEQRHRRKVLGCASLAGMALFTLFLALYSGGMIGFFSDLKATLNVGTFHTGNGIVVETISDFSFVFKWYLSRTVIALASSNSVFVASILILSAIFFCLADHKRRAILILFWFVDVLQGILREILAVGLSKWLNVVGWINQVELPWTIFFAFSVLFLASQRIGVFSRPLSKNKEYLMPALLIATPFFVYAGSSTYSFGPLGMAIVYWVISFYLILYQGLVKYRSYLISVNTILIAGGLLFSGWGYAGIQWHVKYLDADRGVHPGFGGEVVYVTEESGNYYAAMQQLLYRNGFEIGQRVIAFSEQNLALQEALFVAGGRQVGNPIIYSSHLAGELAAKILSRVPIAEAECHWVMLEKGDGSAELLIERIGLSLERDFTLVGNIQTTYLGSKNQKIYKPLKRDCP